MDSHSLRVLEFNKVLDKLASHTSNSLGRETALALEPTSHIESVKRRLQETREARLLLDTSQGMPMGGIRDIREVVERGTMGGRIVPREFLDILSTCAASRRLKQFLQKRFQDVPLLAEIGGNLPQFPILEQKITDSISDNADVRDSASPELARIRSTHKTTHSKLMEKLNNVLSSERYKTFIQEPIITLRDGRYCIPVKSDNRAIMGGIVHDSSASGATSFVEPAVTVELQNQLRDLTVQEQNEVERILTKLVGLVMGFADDLRAMVGFLANLDVANAKAHLAEEMQAVEPRINRKGICHLISARHPLLVYTVEKVVPIDLELGDQFTTLIITGPNTGGKTVSLKTLGLMCLMNQCGMQVPASEGTELALFDQIFADIGDEQDIQMSLSTFSAHLKNIVRILHELGRNALVLLDEVGAGTDPSEGSALAKAILEELRTKNARVIATSHYGELKEYAFSNAKVQNAAVEFDRETLGPTYRILLGVPGSSHAFYIAERIGLEKRIVDAGRNGQSARDANTADLLQQIEESRKAAFAMEREARRASQQTEKLREEYERRVREIEDVRATVRQNAEEEARLTLRKAAEKAENIIEELRKMHRGARKGPSARQKLSTLKREISDELASESIEIEPEVSSEHIYNKGDRVRVISLGLDGELIEEPKEGVVAVQIGSMRATLPLGQLRPSQKTATKHAAPPRNQASEIQMRKALYISPELNLRAMRVDEAMPLLDRYLDDAFAAGLKEVRIIHGKGTGALRKFVSDYLKSIPLIESFRIAEESEGGSGATVAIIKS